MSPRIDPLLERRRNRGNESRLENLQTQIRHAQNRRVSALAGVEQCKQDFARVQAELDRVQNIGAARAAEVDECARSIELMSAQVEQLTAQEAEALARDVQDQAEADLAAAQADVTRRKAELKTLSKAQEGLLV